MKKILNISMLLLIAINCFSQKIKFDAFVKDAFTLCPVKNANISIEGSSMGTTTNEAGFFSLILPKDTTNLIITHINYKKEIYITALQKTANQILLTPQITELKTVNIQSYPIRNITKKLAVYVIDYLFVENKILLLVYHHKKINDIRLLLIDYAANVLLEKKINQAEELYIDCFDNIYYLSKNEAIKIDIKPTEIAILSTIPLIDFNTYNKAIDFKINDNIYFHTFHYHGFVMKLHCINLFDEENEKRTIRTIADSSKIDIFESEFNFFYYAKRAQSYGMSVTSVYKNLNLLRNYQPLDWEDIHGRFSPLKTTVIRLKDNICVFNTTTSTIEIYTSEGRIIHTLTALFIRDKNYTGKIISDESEKKLYAIYKEQSKIQLKEIDIVSGSLKAQINFPDFPFIDNIKIKGNHVYFLYKKNMNEELKQLYNMQI